jgi:hypothetical protein
MMKPEITKKTSTPMKPPDGQASRWSRMTATTASARSPWMSPRKDLVLEPSGATVVGGRVSRARALVLVIVSSR